MKQVARSLTDKSECLNKLVLAAASGTFVRRERLGGLLNYYYRRAA
jgi:hypothetical protein